MARTARTTTHFVLTAEDKGGVTVMRDYNVEERQGQVRRTVGRVYGGGNSWMGLPIGGTAWTCRHTTRAAALDAMRRRENCVEVQVARDIAAAAADHALAA